jgi:predicted dehydrogenase
MNPIKTGIIGFGNMGKNHVRLVSEINEFDLIGIYDNDPAKSPGPERDNFKFFSTAGELFSSAEAVIIASPSSTHHRLALEAAKHGLHVLVEKPLGIDYKEAIEIRDAFNAGNSVLAVGHVERFNPVILEVEKLLEHEEIIAINTRRFSPRDIRIKDVDVVQDLLIHDLDIVVNCLNRSGIKRLHANGRTSYSEYYVDFAHALIEFEDGVLATLEASRATEDKVRDIDIHTQNSFIRMDLLNRTVTITRRTNYKLDTGYSPTYRQENIIERVFIQMTEPLRAELIDFAKCIRTGSEPRVTADDACYVLKFIDKIKQQIYETRD